MTNQVVSSDSLSQEVAPNAAMPAGLTVQPEYLSAAQQKALLTKIDESEWSGLGVGGRRVQQYGPVFDHKTRSLVIEGVAEIPEWLDLLASQLVENGIFDKKPDQVIINEYLPGQGIRPHVDRPEFFGNTVVSISLGSAVPIIFSSLEEQDKSIEIYAQPGDLVEFSDEARYRWRHEIPARDSDLVGLQDVPRARRVSITFRNVIISGESPFAEASLPSI